MGDPFESAPKELGGLAGGLGSRVKISPRSLGLCQATTKRALYAVWLFVFFGYTLFGWFFRGILGKGVFQTFEYTSPAKLGTLLSGLLN